MSGARALSRAQREKVSEFVGVTGAPDGLAAECLAAAEWGLERAVDLFYSSGLAARAAAGRPRADAAALRALFERYADAGAAAAGEPAILAEGIFKLCEDLEVEPEDVALLALSHRLGAAAMGVWTRAEFEGGLARLGVDSLEGLAAALPRLRAELDDPGTFRKVYRYAFGFACDPGQRLLPLDTAAALWALLLPDARWARTAAWCEFLRARGARPVARDLWNMLLDFIAGVDQADFAGHDGEGGAWPYLIDEFVAEQQEAAAAQGGGEAMRD
jgi:DCN1-like protein 1/2